MGTRIIRCFLNETLNKPQAHASTDIAERKNQRQRFSANKRAHKRAHKKIPKNPVIISILRLEKSKWGTQKGTQKGNI